MCALGERFLKSYLHADETTNLNRRQFESMNIKVYHRNITEMCTIQNNNIELTCNHLVWWLVETPTPENSKKYIQVCGEEMENSYGISRTCYEIIEQCQEALVDSNSAENENLVSCMNIPLECPMSPIHIVDGPNAEACRENLQVTNVVNILNMYLTNYSNLLTDQQCIDKW